MKSLMYMIYVYNVVLCIDIYGLKSLGFSTCLSSVSNIFNTFSVLALVSSRTCVSW